LRVMPLPTTKMLCHTIVVDHIYVVTILPDAVER
jgi:hypothetical protein